MQGALGDLVGAAKDGLLALSVRPSLGVLAEIVELLGHTRLETTRDTPARAQNTGHERSNLSLATNRAA